MKPTFFNLINSHQFIGLDHEDPYTHLSTFYELIGTMRFEERDLESMYIRLFSFLLGDKVKSDLNPIQTTI